MVQFEMRGNAPQPHDDRFLIQSGRPKRITVTVPSHALVPHFLVGTDRIATIQRRQAEIFARLHPLRILEMPIRIPLLREVFQWHFTNNDDPVLDYVRERVRALCPAAAPSSRVD